MDAETIVSFYPGIPYLLLYRSVRVLAASVLSQRKIKFRTRIARDFSILYHRL